MPPDFRRMMNRWWGSRDTRVFYHITLDDRGSSDNACGDGSRDARVHRNEFPDGRGLSCARGVSDGGRALPSFEAETTNIKELLPDQRVHVPVQQYHVASIVSFFVILCRAILLARWATQSSR